MEAVRLQRLVRLLAWGALASLHMEALDASVLPIVRFPTAVHNGKNTHKFTVALPTLIENVGESLKHVATNFRFGDYSTQRWISNNF